MSWTAVDTLKEKALAWQAEREEIMAREEVSSRWADDIAHSDDYAAEIAHELAELAKKGET